MITRFCLFKAFIYKFCIIGTNVLRLAVIRKYKLPDDFELSQNYLFFYGEVTISRKKVLITENLCLYR